jgi:hypothetical protein
MASPRTVINLVLSLLERSDFRQKAETSFYAALKKAHAFKFGRDIASVTATPITWLGDTASVPTPARLKEILSISSTSLPPNTIFKPSFGNPSMADYFGYPYPYSYAFSGNTIELRGIPPQDSSIVIKGLFWPTFYLTGSPQDYASDSWILNEYKELVAAYLFAELAPFQSREDIKKSAQDYLQSHLTTFSSVYAGEFL